MIIPVPVDREQGHKGYGPSEHEMVDDMGEERRLLESGSRATSFRGRRSIDRDSDAGFVFKSSGRSNTVRKGRGDSGEQLYTEYLRSSLSTGSGRDSRHKNSFSVER
jgi:hypothetical protein